MMQEEKAGKLLQSRVLRVAAQGDFRVIRRLLTRVLDADIPCMLGQCTVDS